MLAKQIFPILHKVLRFLTFLYIWQCLQCADGRLCDTKRDRSDGSDEKFEVCFWNQCPDGYQCAYGACYTKEQECDGKIDCWDGTDEHWQRCASFNEIHKKNKEMHGDCRNDQFQCRESGECISSSALCDGAVDCRDGSDETWDMCLSSMCPFDTFRCAYGGCIPRLSACDHQTDCADASDEIPSICRKMTQLSAHSEWSVAPRPKGAPKPVIGFEYYPEIHHTEAPPSREGYDKPSSSSSAQEGCRVPLSDNTLNVKTLFNTIPYIKNQSVPHGTVVRLSCVKNYAIKGDDINSCFGGTWQGHWPECVKTCNKNVITNDWTIRATCGYKANSIDCNNRDVKLFVGTKVTIDCAPGYIKNPTVERYCTEDGWKQKTGDKKCIPDCGRLLPTVQHRPWVVSLFQQANFKCFGVILSPKLILAHSSCITSNSSSVYTIVQGNHTVSFNETQEHGYTLHYLDKFILTGALAYLSLINPLILSAHVRPVCFTRSLSSDFGEPFARLNTTDNKYYLQSVLDSRGELFNINPYRNIINHKKINSERI